MIYIFVLLNLYIFYVSALQNFKKIYNFLKFHDFFLYLPRKILWVRHCEQPGQLSSQEDYSLGNYYMIPMFSHTPELNKVTLFLSHLIPYLFLHTKVKR